MFIRSVRSDRGLDAFRVEVREFCRTHMPAEIRRKQQRSQHLDREEYDAWLKLLGRQGWLTGKWPKQYGGQEWEPEQFLAFEEELGMAGAPPLETAGFALAGPVIYTFGTPEQKKRYLYDIARNNTWWCQGYSEPEAGSDLASLKTRAVRDGDHYVLNGAKQFISGAGDSDIYVVMVRTGGDGPKGISTLVVEKNAPGLSFGGLEHKMGWHMQSTRQVNFTDCRVPVANLLSDEGVGFRIAMAGLDGGRLNIAACSLGGAQSALDKAVAYTAERKAFGQPINQFQALQFRLADMETELQASRVFLYAAASKLDRKAPDAGKWSAMAKRFVTDAGFRVANEALQLHGGYGYLHDYGIEKLVRDLRVHQILEGTNEIMRLIIARALIGR